MPEPAEVVRVRHGFAWNSSVEGTRSEDTIVAGALEIILDSHARCRLGHTAANRRLE